MSKITNDGLTWSDTGCFVAVRMYATMGVKGLNLLFKILQILELFVGSTGPISNQSSE